MVTLSRVFAIFFQIVLLNSADPLRNISGSAAPTVYHKGIVTTVSTITCNHAVKVEL